MNKSKHELADGFNNNLVKFKLEGSREAGYFTKEITESVKGVLKYNLLYKDEDNPFLRGFISASAFPDKTWYNTMWTRDAGAFLRELSFLGYLSLASDILNSLCLHLRKNDEGFWGFPEYFKPGEKASGTEWDGTASILLGAYQLWKRVERKSEIARSIGNLFNGIKSPLDYVHLLLQKKNNKFLIGTGEFGGGLYIPEPYCNIVQNYGMYLALLAGSRLAIALGDKQKSAIRLMDAKYLFRNIIKYFCKKGDNNSPSSWWWCLSPDISQPTKDGYHQLFSGILGTLTFYADFYGYDLMNADNTWLRSCEATFNNLYNCPIRRKLFGENGFWSQFYEKDKSLAVFDGYATSAYGQGYAIQSMLLLDRISDATRAINYLAKETREPRYKVKRSSPWHFYERYYTNGSEERYGKLEEGEGALNLVNVAEPLKVVRIILGIDDSIPNTVCIIPRLPNGWTSYHVENWKVSINELKKAHLSIQYKREGSQGDFQLKAFPSVPKLKVRLGPISSDKCRINVKINGSKDMVVPKICYKAGDSNWIWITKEGVEKITVKFGS